MSEAAIPPIWRGMNDAAPPPDLIDEAAYEARALAELSTWRGLMLKDASRLAKAGQLLQTRVNAIIPERVHATLTGVIEGMTRAIVAGSDLTTAKPLVGVRLSEREAQARRRIAAYRAVGATEGGVAGAGGFALSLAEFPALLTTKIKLLFEIAALYGHDGGALSERLYILSIFQLAFSSADHRREVFAGMSAWDTTAHPESLKALDWRRLQQEYRDYIDLAKLAQLIPVIGAPVGAVVNYRLIDKLGETAIGAYRMRWFGGAGEADV